ncbi:MAG TPA: hypothetical protein VFZ83_05165 [Acidimicrobiia bacterium]|nr:hypothetical protein [Acidimicrobiia bacterium]
MPRPRDRVVGVAVATLASVALLVTAVIVESPPIDLAFANDPAAQADLVALIGASEQARYLVEFSTTRTLPDGSSRAEPVTEAQVPPRRVVVGASTATIDIGADRTRCTMTDEGAQCLPEPRDPDALTSAQVYDAALVRGIYAVRPAPARRIAGEPARCFELVAVAGVLPDLGLVAERCFAADGIPLADRVATSSVDDRRVARSVRRDVDADDLAALLDRFGAVSEEAAAS